MKISSSIESFSSILNYILYKNNSNLFKWKFVPETVMAIRWSANTFTNFFHHNFLIISICNLALERSDISRLDSAVRNAIKWKQLQSPVVSFSRTSCNPSINRDCDEVTTNFWTLTSPRSSCLGFDRARFNTIFNTMFDAMLFRTTRKHGWNRNGYNCTRSLPAQYHFDWFFNPITG